MRFTSAKEFRTGTRTGKPLSIYDGIFLVLPVRNRLDIVLGAGERDMISPAVEQVVYRSNDTV
jgi:hypothetical protein